MTYKLRSRPAADESSSELGDLLVIWLQKGGPDAMFRTCNNCSFMSKGNEPAFCNLFKMTPPAHVIINGCEKHADVYEQTHNPYETPF